MGARKTKGTKDVPWSDKTRERIKTSMIINRLVDHISSPEDVMSTSQVRAAEILLRKTLPDLKGIEHSAEEGKLNITQIITGVPRREDV